jgi:hypothetical protein
MQSFTPLRPLAGLALLAALSCASAIAQDDHDNREIKHVFVIAMENHNWTQPATLAGNIQPIFQNPNAPFINSLVNGTAVAWINGQPVNISQHTAYAASYHNVLATQSGNNPHIRAELPLGRSRHQFRHRE